MLIFWLYCRKSDGNVTPLFTRDSLSHTNRNKKLGLIYALIIQTIYNLKIIMNSQ